MERRKCIESKGGEQSKGGRKRRERVEEMTVSEGTEGEEEG